jgi:CDP-glycerol glycerophosphotransferase
MFRGSQLARRVAKRARRLRAKAARLVRRGGLAAYYRWQCRQPIDPNLAVFAAYWYRDYACNPRAIHEKLRELAPWIRGVWVIERERADRVPPQVEHVEPRSREYFRLLARAKYFVNNVNFPNHFVKRDGTVHVQTHHGTPLKKMGLDLRQAFVASRRMDFDRLMRRAARWDYSVSSNAFSTEIWRRAYPLPYETLEVGYPRNDRLVNATSDERKRIREELGIEPGRTTVLYAPTHREYLAGYEPMLDLGRVAAELGSDYVILARAHYLYAAADDLRELHAEGRIIDVSQHPSVEDVCLAADVLVTDYSAIMFDYAVLDRPIVIHAPDWDVYRTLRGTYFDLLAEPPGVVTRTDDELVDAFRSGAVWGEESSRLRAAFRAKFCALEDGRAAERVVRRVWLGEAEGAPAPGGQRDRSAFAAIEG